MKKIKEKQLSEAYVKVIPKYEKLGVNIKQAIEFFLHENELSYLTVDFRVKDIDSFLKKIERKNYSKPFEETEDICGLRIICYYRSDIDKICKIINDEFVVLESQDKEELLKPNQFGYRSHHLIVKIRENWLTAPNYRGLENLKAEIQVRTNLMHTWAEIEHKLEYKKEQDIPNQFKRKFSMLSAKLEEADEQFEELKKDILEYRNQIMNAAKEVNTFISDTTDVNLDKLQVFLDYYFPDRKKDIEDTSDLLSELETFNFKIADLACFFEKAKDILHEMEKDENEIMDGEIRWTQGGIARAILCLNSDAYLEFLSPPPEIMDLTYDYIKKLKDR
jgi:ppGpp synthetase/RelA/SpoT-type nucleotidyltranferase